MKTIKRMICTTLAALTIISSSAAVVNYATDNSFNTSISANAANDPAAQAQALINSINQNIDKANKEIKDCENRIAYLKKQLNNANNQQAKQNIREEIRRLNDRIKVLKDYKANLQNILKSLYFKQYTGNSSSLVEALKAIGAKYSFDYRKEIAIINGIKNYTGTAAQNTKMLNLLKKGKLLKPDVRAIVFPVYPW
ncbi:MAG: hypothetical protein K5884_02915 [Ruminococcus sp.]|uniref:hypothetical protein n=1 Tax=uncultured Ruminococcus sp. TaxID=165186 RepID=UPI00260CFADD|nr:hypothetical protein [uncultured Ruminococcus sp.]MCR4861555.1 hypothetical protein [Ruminococcus sp.]